MRSPFWIHFGIRMFCFSRCALFKNIYISVAPVVGSFFVDSTFAVEQCNFTGLGPAGGMLLDFFVCIVNVVALNCSFRSPYSRLLVQKKRRWNVYRLLHGQTVLLRNCGKSYCSRQRSRYWLSFSQVRSLMQPLLVWPIDASGSGYIFGTVNGGGLPNCAGFEFFHSFYRCWIDLELFFGK